MIPGDHPGDGAEITASPSWSPGASSALSSRGRGSSFLLQLAGFVIVVAGLRYGGEILVPVSLAALLSFLLAPLAYWLERLRLGRVPSVITVVLVLLVTVGSLSYVVVQQLSALANSLPRYAQQAEEKLDALFSSFRSQNRKVAAVISQLGHALDVPQAEAPPEKAGQAEPPNPAPKASPFRLSSEAEPIYVRVVEPPSSALLQKLRAITPVFDPVETSAIVVVLLIFFLLRREDLRDRCIRLIGNGSVSVPTQALNEAGQRVSRYLVTQSLINGTFGVAVALGLYALGMPSWALWGFLAGVLRFLPYIGIALGAGAPIILLAVTTEGWTMPLGALGMFIVLELLAYVVCEPWLFRISTGVSSLAILVSAFFWTWVWGPIGLILATPITVCLVVLGKYIPQLRTLTLLLGDEEPLARHEQYYQRLVNDRLDEAESWIVAQASGRSISDIYDEVVTPALRAARKDASAGQLSEPRFRAVLSAITDAVDTLGEGQEGSMDAARPGESSTERIAGLPSTPCCKIACIPARDDVDELPARMIAQVLNESGYVAVAFSSQLLVAEVKERLEDDGFDVGLIVMLQGSSRLHAERLARRLGAGSPRVPLGLVVWGSAAGAAALREDASNLSLVFTSSSASGTLAALNAQGYIASRPVELVEVGTGSPGLQPGEDRSEKKSRWTTGPRSG
ncbi:MAG TPA: AI-2E family transporter [Planctomycetota bacterium]|jgi:predicted PurR-regulated permease PerM|nr:AI-2E family transporter [Planctomycetota bacterium]